MDDAIQIRFPEPGGVAVRVGDVGGLVALVVFAVLLSVTFTAVVVEDALQAVLLRELAQVFDLTASRAAFLTPLAVHAIV